MAVTIFLFLVLLGFCLFVYLTFWRDKLIRRRPFPASWEDILQDALPVYRRLDREERSRLQQLIHLFLAKKRFYGCAGLEIDDEIRLTIAAEACLLLLNQGWQVYPGLQSILVYPTAFRAEREQQREDGTVAMTGHDLLGESWDNGRVILSWDDVERGAAGFSDGHNVVLHEFAHQLDGQSGSTNGAPPLRRNSYQSWARVFSESFEDLRSRSELRQPTVLDHYGASSPAEFFAVATEAFFEQPHQLRRHRPGLYAELQRYYQLDPRRWHGQGS